MTTKQYIARSIFGVLGMGVLGAFVKIALTMPPKLRMELFESFGLVAISVGVVFLFIWALENA